MRILIATPNLGFVGGIETHLATLLPLLRDAGHEIAVVYENDSGNPSRTILINCPQTPAWEARSPTVEDILPQIAAWSPDVVYGHGMVDPRRSEALAQRFPGVFFAHTYHGT